MMLDNTPVLKRMERIFYDQPERTGNPDQL